MTKKKKPRRIYNCFKCKDRNWLKPCECGFCNDLMPLCDKSGRTNRFKPAHHLRRRNNSIYNPKSLQVIFRGLYKYCECGCKYLIPIVNKKGELAKYENHHYCRGKKPQIQNGRYTMDLRPDHPFATERGYVRTHRLALEAHYSEVFGIPIFILPCFEVHHKDGNTRNNHWRNLEMVTKREHVLIHHPKIDTSGRVCIYPRCNMKYKKIKNPQWCKYKGGYICRNCHRKDMKLKETNYNPTILPFFF